VREARTAQLPAPTGENGALPSFTRSVPIAARQLKYRRNINNPGTLKRSTTMDTNNNGSRKLLLQKQTISNADLAYVFGGDDNTSKVVSGAVSAIASGVSGGIASLPGAPASTAPVVVSAAGSAAASAGASQAVSDLVSRLSNPFNSF
jgi:hypothetical protein